MTMVPTTSPCPPALTADAMQAADRFAMEDYGLPSFTLMEAAGRGCTEAIREAYGPLQGKEVVVLCGKGNNGGDGLVVARHLHTAGAHVHVVLAASFDALRDDPARNLNLLQQLRDETDASNRLVLEALGDGASLDEDPRLRNPDLYVDALLGTGLTSALRDPIDAVVDWLNDRPVPVVAVDVPTGLHSDTGAVMGSAVRADRTVTMAAPKVGLRVGEGPAHAGTVDPVDIGIPPFVIDRAAQEPGCARETTDAAVQTWWPDRAPDAYKYSVGTALVVGGTPRFAGAPAMASKAAVRSGAGYVTCACPETAQSTLAGLHPSIPTLPLPTAADGGIAPEEALRVLEDEQPDALLVGPGLGRANSTERFVQRLAEVVDGPLVIDADGLNALAARPAEEVWAHADADWILTPHAGEFRRLVGEAVDLTDRVRVAQEYAQRWGVVLLLKGAPSLVAGPDGRTMLASTGTPALAAAGTGDVLAGQCVGHAAQGMPPLEAAATALHLGGAAARRYAATRDARSMAATDLLDELPRAARERLGARARQ